MGDKVLKKISIFIIFICIVMYAKVSSKDNYQSINIQKYDMIFEKISQKRVGLNSGKIDKIKSPFISQNILKIIKDKNITKLKYHKVLKLYGLLNNKANINKKWYKIGSKIDGYKLIKVKDSSVTLKKNRKKIELFLRKKNDKIQITKLF